MCDFINRGRGGGGSRYLTSKRSSRAMKMPGMTMSPRPSMAKLLAPSPFSNRSWGKTTEGKHPSVFTGTNGKSPRNILTSVSHTYIWLVPQKIWQQSPWRWSRTPGQRDDRCQCFHWAFFLYLYMTTVKSGKINTLNAKYLIEGFSENFLKGLSWHKPQRIQFWTKGQRSRSLQGQKTCFVCQENGYREVQLVSSSNWPHSLQMISFWHQQSRSVKGHTHLDVCPGWNDREVCLVSFIQTEPVKWQKMCSFAHLRKVT